MRIKKPSPTRGRRHGGAVTDEGAANLIQPLSQPSAASSPERGAMGPLRRGSPLRRSAPAPLNKGSLGACKSIKPPRKKVQTSKSGLHLLLIADILR